MKRILESMAGQAIIVACLAFVFSFSLSVSVLAATTVGNNVAVGGTLDVTGITTLTAALVANGAVTLGDSVGDSITITGKLGTIYVSDGSTTSTHAKNSLTLGEATNYNKGVFYVDSSGNVSASGTMAVVGAATLTGALVANGAVTLGDSVGDSITITGKLGTIYVSDGSTTSTHAKNSLTLGEATDYNLGKFYVDPSGNVSASGTLAVIGNATLTADLTIDTNTLYVSSSNNKVGVVSSTPFAQLSIGAGGAVSSTISVGKFCMYAGQENGVNVYVILGANQANNQPFATTTVSCF